MQMEGRSFREAVEQLAGEAGVDLTPPNPEEARRSARRAALGEVNDLAMTLGEYHLLHSTRAELLDQLGEKEQARQARLRALELCQNPAERALLERRLGG